jgi:hypothetical protein
MVAIRSEKKNIIVGKEIERISSFVCVAQYLVFNINYLMDLNNEKNKSFSL